MKKVILATLISVAAITFAAGKTSANDVAEQKQVQEVTTKTEETCEQTGEYGNKKCVNKSETTVKQAQNQKLLADRNIYGRNGNKTHKPADTAINTTTVAIILAAAFLGLGASVALTKIA